MSLKSFSFAKHLLFGMCAGLLVALAFSLVTKQPPLLSPITSSTTFRFLAPPEEKTHGAPKIVYGFLPYWNVNKAKIHPELTHLAYFSLTIAADGSIITQQNGKLDSGYAKWSDENTLDAMAAHQKNKGKVELVLTQFKAGDIEAFLANPKAHQQLFKSLDSIILASPVDGVNIDIEYTGTVTPTLRQQLVTFMKSLDEHLQQKHPEVKISIDIYSGAAKGQYLWDIEQLQHSVDHIIVMAYDFHRPSSSVAGPVAPLFSDNSLWSQDITKHIREFLKTVPKEKIILGVPFYGYEWQTTSRESQALTYPDTGSTASFDQITNLLQHKNDLQLEEHWNDVALAPYISYKENNATYLIYYENSRSLSYKLDLVNQLDLGGIAIWALGYEGDSRELWDVIQRKLK